MCTLWHVVAAGPGPLPALPGSESGVDSPGTSHQHAGQVTTQHGRTSAHCLTLASRSAHNTRGMCIAAMRQASTELAARTAETGACVERFEEEGTSMTTPAGDPLRDPTHDHLIIAGPDDEDEDSLDEDEDLDDLDDDDLDDDLDDDDDWEDEDDDEDLEEEE